MLTMTRTELTQRARRGLRSVPNRVRRARSIRWGNIGYAAPFSQRYGRDRGQVIDRALLDAFFDQHRLDVTGDVLEVRDPGFTNRFGSSVSSIEIVDIDPTNERVTILGDLNDDGLLGSKQFDCIIFPQTL